MSFRRTLASLIKYLSPQKLAFNPLLSLREHLEDEIQDMVNDFQSSSEFKECFY